MEKKKRGRVILSKIGLDGHDRGILAVAIALRDAGMEVIYLGRHVRAEEIVQAAIQEDIDLVGLSSLTDAHRTHAPKVVKLLREAGRGDIPVVLGGFIQPDDIPALKEDGIVEVFPTASKLDDIVEFVKSKVR